VQHTATWIVVAATGALLSCPAAHAAADCSASTTAVAFGTYDLLATTPDDSVGNVTVVCTYVSGGTSQVGFTVALSAGNAGNYAQRQLKSGTAVLGYNLFTDSARSQVWGNGGAGTTVASGSFTIGPGAGNRRREASYPVYGRVPALQDAPPGSYSDSIVVTLAF
jgi:spore coat protein U-like protein